jgi:hypothetical protein
LKFFIQLYEIEREVRDLPAAKRRTIRQDKIKLIADAHLWLTQQRRKVRRHGVALGRQRAVRSGHAHAKAVRVCVDEIAAYCVGPAQSRCRRTLEAKGRVASPTRSRHFHAFNRERGNALNGR